MAAGERTPTDRHEANPDSRAESTTLLAYRDVIVRRKWVFLLTVVIVPLSAVLIALHETPLYEASAEVLLRQQNLAASLSGVTDSTASLQPDRAAQTQAKLARVPEVAQRTLEAVGLRDRTPLEFLGASSVDAQSNADLLEFHVHDRDPPLAKRLATAYAKQFVVYRSSIDSQALDQARRGIRRRLAQLRAAGATRSGLYADLTAKEQQLIALESLETTGALVVRPADAVSQIRPRVKRDAVLALCLGVLLGIGLAFLMEAVDTRLRNAEEVEERLRIPLLGRLPSSTQKGSDGVEMLTNPASQYAEAIRTLRVRLGLATQGSGIRVIMVTSATEGEGKSTTVANLATALAQAGRRVALCDLDARRPSIARIFGLEARSGVIDVALGFDPLEQALIKVPIGDTPYWAHEESVNGNSRSDVRGVLEVLTFGRTPPDPGEFLSSVEIGEILDRLRARADIVLVDAPSLLGIGDAMTLSRAVDALLIVARLDFVRRSTLSELRGVLASCPASSLGCILTGAEATGYRYEYVPQSPESVPAAAKRAAERE